MTSAPSHGTNPGLTVEVVTIGDELLLGFTIDTNAAFVARRLADLGVRIVRRSTVGDDPDQIKAGVADALARTHGVITTGGLGPTSDDRTKQAIAELFGRSLRVDEEHLAWMRQRWETRFNRPMPEANRQQAMLPEGAVKLVNNHGSAPGVWLEDPRLGWVAMLPGVPREMRGMLDDTVLPRLRHRLSSAGGDATVVRSRTLRTTGVAESLLADLIEKGAPLPADDDRLSLAYLPSGEGVDLRLTIRGVSSVDAGRILDDAAGRVRATVGDAVFGEGAADLAAVVLDQCRVRQLTIGVAESCTGGLLGARLTAIPGSSDVVRGGVIAYHNDVKRALLSVSAESLAADGAVSESVVRQMAAGVRLATGASIGVAVTGVAGPSGGTPDKPVGTVWIAADFGDHLEARLLRLWGDRAEIRARSAQAALEMVRRALLESGTSSPTP